MPIEPEQGESVSAPPPNRIEVRISKALAALVEPYLERRGDDVATLRAAVAAEDFDTVMWLAHRIKGSGGSMGFAPISTIGEAMEAAAALPDGVAVLREAHALQEYLSQVDVVFE